MATLDATTVCVRLGGHESVPVATTSGLLEGSPYSPVLFALVLARLMPRLAANQELAAARVAAGGVQALKYADDVRLRRPALASGAAGDHGGAGPVWGGPRHPLQHGALEDDVHGRGA